MMLHWGITSINVFQTSKDKAEELQAQDGKGTKDKQKNVKSKTQSHRIVEKQWESGLQQDLWPMEVIISG